jgi:hypothetical protein
LFRRAATRVAPLSSREGKIFLKELRGPDSHRLLSSLKSHEDLPACDAATAGKILKFETNISTATNKEKIFRRRTITAHGLLSIVHGIHWTLTNFWMLRG